MSLNCYYFLHIFCVHNNNCSIDLYNRELQTTIILFSCNVSSHKTDWIISELLLLTQYCLLYRMVSSLMNSVEGECLCLYEISIFFCFFRWRGGFRQKSAKSEAPMKLFLFFNFSFLFLTCDTKPGFMCICV